MWELEPQAAMLPYFYSANQSNYSGWMPIHIITMEVLPTEIEEACENGDFVVRQRPGMYNGIAADMGTEKTVIKDSKGCRGIVGITQKKPAMLQWSLSHHILGEYSMKDFRGHNDKNSNETSHAETLPASMTREEAHVQMLVNFVENHMIDPFDVDSHPVMFIIISTGMPATAEVQP